jgi:parallel beta-helix repeat protein
VTEDVRLDSSLVDCPADGLVAGADGIIIDLNGHVIDGSATGDGVRIKNRHGVTVRGGTIREFGMGVRLEFATGNELSALQLSDNASGGASLLRASNNTLSGLAVVANGAATFGEGVLILTGSDANVVTESTFTGNRFAGVRITNSSRNRIARNDVSDGILLFGGAFETVVEANYVHNTRLEGIGMGAGDNTGNVVSGNRVVGAGRHGIDVSFAADTTVIRNVVLHSAADGIAVGGATDTVLERNRADHNGDDGIGTTEPSTTLTDNRADQNFDLGIEAVAGVTDGGGNRARGNGNPAQCLNVRCR